MKIGDIVRVHKIQGTAVKPEECPFYAVVEDAVDDNNIEYAFWVNMLPEGHTSIVVDFNDTWRPVSPSKVPDYILRALARYHMTGRISGYD